MNKMQNNIAKKFVTLRDSHKTETAEDYVELILELMRNKGSARMFDVARCMGVSQPTATKIVVRLQREGLVFSKPYRELTLTKEGEILARKSKNRHTVVLKFLLALGVSPETAEIDAEGMEHHVSKETLKAFKVFIQSKSEDKNST